MGCDSCVKKVKVPYEQNGEGLSLNIRGGQFTVYLFLLFL